MHTAARMGGHRPLTALLIDPARLVYQRLIDPLRRYVRGRAGKRRLAQLDDRMLRDIGLTRSQVHAAAYGLIRLDKHPPTGATRAPLPSDRADRVRPMLPDSAWRMAEGAAPRAPGARPEGRRVGAPGTSGKEPLMATNIPAWPRKTRELHNHHFDSTIWNDFRFRPDDVVIATYAKAGTTWVQQIVGQLIFGGQEGIEVATLSPWLDRRFPPKKEKLAVLEAQRHRRFIKTHLPVDALVFSPDAKYIYIGRDGRDVVWSLHNHLAGATDEWYRMVNDTPGRVGPPIGRPPASVRRYFLEWLEGDGHPIWSFWDNVASWWAIRHLPNVLFLHFADLKRDLPGQMRRVAAFLEIRLEDERFDAAVRHCSFDYMKAHAEKHAPHGGRLFKGGAQAFVHKGTNGRWRDVLSADECRRYEATAEERLGRPCARWLAGGGSLDHETFSRPSSGNHPREMSSWTSTEARFASSARR